MPRLRTSYTRMRFRFAALILALVGTAVLSAAVGASDVDIPGAIGAILRGDTASVDARVFLYVRLPRTVAAPLAGAALAVAGAIIQGVLINPLAGPNLIGINAGAGLCTMLASILLPAVPGLVPVAAFAGALAASALIYLIAWGAGASRMTVVLAGVAVSAVFGAILDGARLLYPDMQVATTGFMIGGFSGVTLHAIAPAAGLILAGLILTALLSGALDVLGLGEDTARALGMHTTLTRFMLLGVASLLAGAAVSYAGLIGFVGLMAPHMSRYLFRPEHKTLIPACALTGAFMVLACDLLARVAFMPFELPCGIILSLLGGPYFLLLLLKQRRRPVG